MSAEEKLRSSCCNARIKWVDAPGDLGEFMEVPICVKCKRIVPPADALPPENKERT